MRIMTMMMLMMFFCDEDGDDGDLADDAGGDDKDECVDNTDDIRKYLLSLLRLVQVIANMEPFRENKDGSRGDKLPDIASGEGVDIVLESGRCGEGGYMGLGAVGVLMYVVMHGRSRVTIDPRTPTRSVRTSIARRGFNRPGRPTFACTKRRCEA